MASADRGGMDHAARSRTENISRSRSSSLLSAAVEKASAPTRTWFRSLNELEGFPFTFMVLAVFDVSMYRCIDVSMYRCIDVSMPDGYKSMIMRSNIEYRDYGGEGVKAPTIGSSSSSSSRGVLVRDDPVEQDPFAGQVWSPHAYLIVIGTGSEPRPSHIHLHLPYCCRVHERSNVLHPHIRQ